MSDNMNFDEHERERRFFAIALLAAALGRVEASKLDVQEVIDLAEELQATLDTSVGGNP